MTIILYVESFSMVYSSAGSSDLIYSSVAWHPTSFVRTFLLYILICYKKNLIPSPAWLVVSWSKQEVRTVTLVCFFLLLLVMGFAKLSNPPSRYIPPTHPTSSFLEIKNPREYNESLLAIIICKCVLFYKQQGTLRSEYKVNPNHNTLKEEQAQCPLSASSTASVLAKQDT